VDHVQTLPNMAPPSSRNGPAGGWSRGLPASVMTFLAWPLLAGHGGVPIRIKAPPLVPENGGDSVPARPSKTARGPDAKGRNFMNLQIIRLTGQTTETASFFANYLRKNGKNVKFLLRMHESNFSPHARTSAQPLLAQEQIRTGSGALHDSFSADS